MTGLTDAGVFIAGRVTGRGAQVMTREEAWDLLKEYNKDEFHLEHTEMLDWTLEELIENTIEALKTFRP